ncbi:MAG: hypothetical protein DMG05_07950 [Acidobacteria bacterium]|nr:MAG: hypothetical protein DMG05_07950 [Acidobacteriota bacterium]
MRWLKLLIFVVFVMSAILSIRSLNFSKPVDAKKTGKSCVYCHTKVGSKELTEAGKYYKENGTLDGYKPSK